MTYPAPLNNSFKTFPATNFLNLYQFEPRSSLSEVLPASVISACISSRPEYTERVDSEGANNIAIAGMFGGVDWLLNSSGVCFRRVGGMNFGWKLTMHY